MKKVMQMFILTACLIAQNAHSSDFWGVWYEESHPEGIAKYTYTESSVKIDADAKASSVDVEGNVVQNYYEAAIGIKTTVNAELSGCTGAGIAHWHIGYINGQRLGAQIRLTTCSGSLKIEYLVKNFETGEWIFNQNVNASGNLFTFSIKRIEDTVYFEVDGYPTKTYNLPANTAKAGVPSGLFAWAVPGSEISANFSNIFMAYAIMYVSQDGVCGGKTPCYTSIQAAIDAAATGSTILVGQGTYEKSLSLGSAKTLLIKGGYNDAYDQQTANTTFIQAPSSTSIKASSGSLRFQMINVK